MSLTPGETVVDRGDDSDYPSHAVVLETVNVPARNYPIAELDGQTVAELNPEYPADADVVLVAFAKDLDEILPGWEDYTARQLRKHTEQTRLQVYAYPAPRLRRVDTGDAAPNPGGGAHV